jgi:hypothetical protein
MRGRFVLLCGLLLGAGCSSGESSSPSCPSSLPVNCTGDDLTWCCPADSSCGTLPPDCVSACPAATPVLCNPGEALPFCCVAGTRCAGAAGAYECVVGTDAGGAGSGSGGSSSSSGGAAGSTASDCPEPCGGTCCDPKSRCVFENGTTPTCELRCTTSSQCSADAPCCGEATSTCRPSGQDFACMCTTGAECSSGSCGPSTTRSFATPPQIGADYICKSNDGKPYDGCNGLTFCETGSCCYADKLGNKFCAVPCTADSQCGNMAKCIEYDASHTTCLGSLGCGLP